MENWWKNYPWRLIQTNLREIDMLDIQAAQVVKDLQSFHATVLMINAAGIIASYPTCLPFHFQSPYLKGDSLLEIVDACHSKGIRVIARTDFSKIRQPIFQQHPEWAYRNTRGETVDYNGDVHVCVNSWYQQEGILQILDELFNTHPFDGVFFNMGGYVTYDYSGNYHGPCCCKNCQEKFGSLFNQEFPFQGDRIPHPQDIQDNVRYVEFKRLTLKDQEDKINTFLTNSLPHLCIANLLESNRGFIRQESNTALDRPLPLLQYSASENTKWAVGSHPEMVSSNTSVDFIDFPYRHVAVSPHEQALRLAQNLANGGALDYYLIGRLDNHADRSGFASVREIFGFHAKNEKIYQGLQSLADILLVKPSSLHQDEYRGWYRVLSEGHFLFDVVTIDAVRASTCSKYSAVILPGIPTLESDLMIQLDQYVADGGVLIAVGTAPRLSVERSNKEIYTSDTLNSLGIKRVEAIHKNLRSPYFQIDDIRKFPHLAETDLVYLEGDYIQAMYDKAAIKYLKLILPHPYGPPERCYYREITDLPGVVEYAYGEGRAIYLSWFPATQYYHHGQLNSYRFMLDVLVYIGGLKRLTGNIPEQVEATLFRNADGKILLHLVNLSGHFGNSYHPPIRMSHLEIKLPWQRSSPIQVSSLVRNQPIKVSHFLDELILYLRFLDQFDVLQITC